MVITAFVKPRWTRVPHKLLLLAGLLGVALNCSGCFILACHLPAPSDYEIRPDGATIRWSPMPRRRTKVTVRWGGGDSRCYAGETSRTFRLPGNRHQSWLDLARMDVPIGSPYTQHCDWLIDLNTRFSYSEVHFTAAETDIWFDPTSPGYEARQARYLATPPPPLSKP